VRKFEGPKETVKGLKKKDEKKVKNKVKLGHEGRIILKKKSALFLFVVATSEKNFFDVFLCLLVFHSTFGKGPRN
jgi:hypothetical protein